MAPSREFRHNHYVPEWYQKRFMAPGQSRYFYLDLRPERVVSSGHTHTRQACRWLGARSCFAQDDLYTVRWGNVINTEIEQLFFGKIDREGRYAVEYFDKFEHPGADDRAFHGLLPYMSVQKMRTPKGLAWISQQSSVNDPRVNLFLLQKIRNIFCAVWTKSVWQLADATNSPVKFIISDHPVTVYNRCCFPMSEYCRGFNDPDIRMVATHTYFPLSLDRVLILTNLSWVRNPYQSEIKLRPNPRLFRTSIFNFTRIQSRRELTEEEVLQINYVTKMRAYRYVAAAQKEWLYPENQLGRPWWNRLGRGYLLMPEPRDVHLGGEVFIGFEGGRTESFSEYGHRPGQSGYRDRAREAVESKALERFQAEFADIQGPRWRGTSFFAGSAEPHVDSEDHHQQLVAKARAERHHDKRERSRR